MWILHLLVFVIAASAYREPTCDNSFIGFSFIPLRHKNSCPQLKCQKWCYTKDIYERIFLACCDFREKPGLCPKGCLFGPRWNLCNIHCNCDRDCPSGYKCCQDDCYRLHKICKPVFYKYDINPTCPSVDPSTRSSIETTTTTVDYSSVDSEATVKMDTTVDAHSTESNTQPTISDVSYSTHSETDQATDFSSAEPSSESPTTQRLEILSPEADPELTSSFIKMTTIINVETTSGDGEESGDGGGIGNDEDNGSGEGSAENDGSGGDGGDNGSGDVNGSGSGNGSGDMDGSGDSEEVLPPPARLVRNKIDDFFFTNA